MERLERLAVYLQGDPHNQALLKDFAEEGLRVGASDRVASVLGPALDRYENAPQELRHLLALAYLAQGRYVESIELLEGLVAEGVSQPAATFNLGYAYSRAGRHEDALARLEPLLRDGPPIRGLLATVMRCCHHLGETPQALAWWNDSSGEFGDAEAQGVASLAMFDAGRLDEARQLSELALSQGARGLEASVVKASLHLLDREAEPAKALAERALKAQPADGRTWSTYAAATLLLGEPAQASASYERAVELIPQHIGSWHGLAWCRILLGDLTGAQAAFDTALALDRNFGETHGGLAVVAALQGQRGQASAHVERALRLDSAGMSAQYAQAILNGTTLDKRGFQEFASKLMRRRGLLGTSAGLP